MKIFLLFVIFFFWQSAPCQNWSSVTLSDTVLDFGEVLSGQNHSRQLIIYNHLNQEIKIKKVTFSKDIFSCGLDTVLISANGQKSFFVHLNAPHNLYYSDFLAIETTNSIHPLIAEVRAQVIYTDAYYSSTYNKWGAGLKSALYNIIKDHTQYPYTSSSTDVWDILKDTDEDPDNPDNVILFYTGWSYKKSDQNTGDNNGWNREHVWAKSHGNFGSDPPAGTDVHHIRPTDVTVNSTRGNLDFDNGGSLYTDDNGATECRFDNDSWEPRDSEKGDAARMLYYMAVRYEDAEGYNLELTNQIPSSPYKEPLFARKSTLYSWHTEDTVDSWERRRNDRIFSWQNNRNPFIDHPEYAERLPSISGTALPVESPEIFISPEIIDLGIVAPSDTANFSFAIINSGQTDLIVSGISCPDNNFIVEKSSLSIAGGSYEFIQLTYLSPSNDGDYTSTVNISSNDSDESLIQIPVAVKVSSSVNISTAKSSDLDYFLYPNYPNPFNPATTISWQLAENSRVRISVFDIRGRHVKTLIENKLGPGFYNVNFSGENLCSGIYFIHLEAVPANPQVKSICLNRRMILLR